MLRKKSNGTAKPARLMEGLASVAGATVDRRKFLARSGLLAGGVAAAGMMPGAVKKADAAAVGPLSAGATRIKSVCTHCAVGCTVIAEVKNGVWVGQEPGYDSPINLGSHCAKGASVREHAHSDRRLKYPLKLVNGQWTRIKWEQAINEIGDKMLEIRKKSGPNSVYWLGSAKFSNEQSYLFRKFAAFWGSNNTDHADSVRVALYIVAILFPVALICAIPRVLTTLVQLALKLLRRPPLEHTLTWPGVLRVVGWSAVGYTMFGAHLWLLANAQATPGMGGLLRSIGSFAIAMTVGMFAFLSPSGLGVREAVLVAALAPYPGRARWHRCRARHRTGLTADLHHRRCTGRRARRTLRGASVAQPDQGATGQGATCQRVMTLVMRVNSRIRS